MIFISSLKQNFFLKKVRIKMRTEGVDPSFLDRPDDPAPPPDEPNNSDDNDDDSDSSG